MEGLHALRRALVARVRKLAQHVVEAGVAQGEPGRFAESLRSALDRISWCSADPLCMESEAGGVSGRNHAACHACVLLPETSCETNNTFLDRALLVGTPDERVIGFFS